MLEVLVAFVVLALVATALFRLFSGALANASAADDYSRAVLTAQSAIEQAAAGVLREGVETGTVDEGRVRWTVRIAPYATPDTAPDLQQLSEALPVRLYRIVAEVAFPSPNGGQRTLALATLRIGPKDAP